ncbi:MAG TPA: CADD family putative folate metabolism protein [Candidatus Marinimicrobia bacterium]|nr:CADD family putative folate metabolism protein [Candidatus Neomarinimicrobiota bacterium]
MYLKVLDNKLDEFHLLKHPFYVAWNEGELTQEILQDYAEQYYQHIKAFPRYISATHSLCEDIEQRKILLDNLSDEEDFEKDHPMLWKQFALAVGADKNDVETIKQADFTKDMIANFFRLARSSYAEGLGSLYAYERQVPEIADTKIKGLIEHYNVSSDVGLEYFVVHKDADVEHREQSAILMNQLSEEDRKLAEEAGMSTVKMLWSFLSGLCEKYDIKMEGN